MRRRKNHLYLSLPPPLVLYTLLLAVLLEYFLTILSCTSWQQANQRQLMGQEIERPKLLLLLRKDQAATHGNMFCVLAATEVLGEV